MVREGIGSAVRRREDFRFLTGRGQFVEDISVDGMLHCVFVRSPHAHAQIHKIDIAAASATEGVLAILTGSDMESDGIGSMATLWRIAGVNGTKLVEPRRWALARSTVRHVGEPIAMVVASTAAAALDGAEQVLVDWYPMPSVADLLRAVHPNAPILHADAPENVALRFTRGDDVKVAKALTGARHIVKVELVNQRLACAAIEPRAVIAVPSPNHGLDGHEVLLYSTTQIPHHIRKLVSEELHLPEGSIRVIAPDVGGGFGTKGKHYPEEIVLAWASRKLRRPLKWVSTRTEAFTSDYQARDHVTTAELAMAEDGTFLALRVTTLASLGAYVSTAGPAIPTMAYTVVLSGPYRIPAIFADVRLVFTNTLPTDAYRGAGRPEATYVLERLVEAAARQTGIDAIELRRRNLIPASAMPYATPLGPVYDTGDFPKLFERLLEMADHNGFEHRQAESQRKGLLRGFGACYFVESSGAAPSKFAGAFGSRVGYYESADIRVAADGSVLVMCGTHSQGQSHATTFAQVVAARLGVPLSNIEIVEGDTGRVAMGTGTFGSRSMAVGGAAIARALGRVIAKARRVAAHLLEVGEADVEHHLGEAGGEFRVAGTDRKLTWGQVAAAATDAQNLPADLEPVLHASAYYDPVALTWSNGGHACEVEIDPSTGAISIASYVCIDDVGTVVNPLVVEGQIHGGIAQGIGQALFEGTRYDEEGQLLTASFMDYALPRADALPMFLTATDESYPSTHNPLGVKGCGESGTVGAPAAVMSAVLNALSSLGVWDLEMPLTPEKVWRAIQQGKRGDAIGH